MPDFHYFKVEKCFQELKTSKNGLTSKEVELRIKKHGKNELPKEKPLGKLAIFLNQVKSPFIYILLVAGSISLFLGDYIDMGVIFGAVIINTVVGFIQENKANNSLAKLKQLIKHSAIVLRDGREFRIDSSNLTLGDIIFIKAGNRIPADARIIEADNLLVDEAPLTGESIPVEKTTLIQDKGASIADRKNMVYAGTTIVKGIGKAIICGIGRETEIGKIAELVRNTEDEDTPLQIRLNKFSSKLGILVGVISLVIVLVGIIQGREIYDMFITGVAVAVSIIPEGLMVAVTVILVLGMQRILKKKALIRKLVAAETLGSITVICTDKTGTLTEGKMHVAHIIIGEKEFEIKTLGSRQDSKEAKIVSLVLQASMMCSDAVIENPEDALSAWRIIGDPTESALLSAAVQSGLNKEKLLKLEPKVAELPFESSAKYMISLHKKKDKSYVLYEKGAPEKLLAKSENFYHQGKIYKLTSHEKIKLEKIYEKLTDKGLRIIGVATKELKNFDKFGIDIKEGVMQLKEGDWAKIDNELTFIGFVALKDPLRPEAKETISICRQAGIRPVIITGDHRLTAKAIAGEIGLKIKSENIITGEELDKVSDKELYNLVKKIDIYARVSPHHKLRIVKALQARGEVVAMTGDGINDSPALKAADIGISLGTGTDIAKESSDIVLLDNNFKTIVASVREGRIIFSNIRKVMTFLLSDSFSSIIMISGSIIFGTPLAILPVQILWINIVNDGLPDFSLALEKGEKNIMKNKPIKRDEPILNKEMKVIIFGVGIFRDTLIFGLFLYLFKTGTDIDYLRSLFFAILGIKSLMAIFSLRSFKQPIWKMNPFSNMYLVGAVAISTLLMLLAIYLPPLQKVLSTTPLNWNSWLLVISIGAAGIIMTEFAKYYFIAKSHKEVVK